MLEMVMEKSDQWRAKDGYMDFQSERTWNIGLNFAITLWPLNLFCSTKFTLRSLLASWNRTASEKPHKQAQTGTKTGRVGLLLLSVTITYIIYPSIKARPRLGKNRTQLWNCVSPLFWFSHFLWELKKEIISSFILLWISLYIILLRPLLILKN